MITQCIRAASGNRQRCRLNTTYGLFDGVILHTPEKHSSRAAELKLPAVLTATWILLLLAISGCSELSGQSDNPQPDVTGTASIVTTGSNEPGSTGFALEIPDALLQLRNLNSDELFPTVTITANGQQNSFTPPRVSDTAFSGTIDVPVNTEVVIGVDWREDFQNTSLLIATFSGTVPVGNQAVAVELGAMDYETSFDDDGDGFSNLEERLAGSNPLDAESSPLPDPGPPDVSVIVPFIDPAIAPVIDGSGAVYAPDELRLVGEWGGATANSPGANGAGTDLFVDSLMISNTGNPSNPFHAWAAVHDGTFLYLLVLVEDTGTRFGDSAPLADDDSIEIFIDGNNSNLTLYGDPDDRYFRIALLDANGAANNSFTTAGRIERGLNSAPIPMGIRFSVGIRTGPLGISSPTERQDVYEVQIPMAEFGIVAGQPFGIEVQINDDDDGGTRDTKWGWNHPMRRVSNLDLTVSNPSFMGTAQTQ